MTQNQEGVDYRSIFTGLLKNGEDVELALQVARKILALPPQPSQPMGADATEQGRSAEGVSPHFYPGQFYGKSQTGAAADVLKVYGKPQRTKAILEASSRAGLNVGGSNPEANLYRTLLRSKEFIKVAPDTWGLVDWYPQAKLKPPIATPMRGRKRRGRPPKRKATEEASKRAPMRESQTDKSEA